MDLWTRGCELGNFDSCVKLAEKGDLKAAMKAGQLAKDQDGRKKWFGKVCQGGDLKGCEALCTRGIWDGELDGCLKLAENAGKKSSEDEANDEEIKWWLKACDNGNMTGCGMAGSFIKDPNEGAKLLEKACFPPENSQSHPYACYLLGFKARESGDLRKAENYFLKSCNQNIYYEDSCELLKEIRKEIADIELKKKEAAMAPILSKLKAACDKGNLNECYEYGLTLPDPESQKIPWIKKACDGGIPGACFFMGNYSSKENKPADAKKYYLLACDGGHPTACNRLGIIESNKGNQAEAAKFYTKACSAGNTTGCNNLAKLQIDYNSIAEARKYLNEACDSGSNAACQKLVALTKEFK
jgi:TPR repeat protein